MKQNPKFPIINIHKVNSWSHAILDHFKSAKDILRQWVNDSLTYEQRSELSPLFDQVVRDLRPLMKPYYFHGFHCTRLTASEIEFISTKGMILPNVERLEERVLELTSAHTVTPEVAELLLKENQADENYRKDMLWFSFHEPHIAGEMGINRLLRSWGGEALYNSHENNPITGNVLRNIGIPCVIEAFVPLNYLRAYDFELNFLNRYMASKGLDEIRVHQYEGYITQNLPVENIINIAQFHNKKFKKLTHCDSWRNPLT